VRRAAQARRNGRPRESAACAHAGLLPDLQDHPAEGLSARRGDVRRDRLDERVAVMNGGRLDAPVGGGLPHFTGDA